MKKIIIVPKPKRLDIKDIPEDLSNYVIQRKANGVGCVGRKQNGKIILHSRGVSKITGDHILYNDKIPIIYKELETRSIPDDSVWYMELIVDKTNPYHNRIYHNERYHEDVSQVNEILQTDKPHPNNDRIEALILEIFKWDGKDVTKESNEWRYNIIKLLLKKELAGQRVSVPKNHSTTNKLMLLRSISVSVRTHWEGVVLKKKNGIIFYKEYDNLITSSAPRYDSQFKFVLSHKTEVIITGYRLSKDDPTRIGSFEMCWYKKGKLTYIGHCAGLNEEWKQLPKTRPQLPFVADVKYKEITSEGKLLNAVFMRKNKNKNIEECVSEEDKK